MVLLILLCLFGFVLSDVQLGSSNEVLRAKGEMSLDSNGRPYVQCIVSGPGIPQTIQLCSTSKDSAENLTGCATLWNSTDVIMQRCWTQQIETIERECAPSACDDDGRKRMLGINFCCCYGHKCNQVYRSLGT